jgi:protein arginine kinase
MPAQKSAVNGRPSLERMAHVPGTWLLGSGPEPHQVFSTRVRLARNLSSIPFSHRAREEQLSVVLASVSSAARQSKRLHGALALKMSELPPLDRQFLVERHLISRDMSDSQRTRGILISEDESLSVMVNEEDHVRIQSLVSGLELHNAWELADALDDELDQVLEYAFSDELGYLTSCPTNVGTGMRVSVLVHLPSLVHSKKISELLQSLSRIGLAVRGFYGEGSEVMGNFFQVSNQTTLGRSERESLDVLGKATRQLLEHEEQARDYMLRAARDRLQDMIWRAYGTLRYARSIRSQEVVSLTSLVRFGVALELPDLPDVRTLNEILVFSQPAHLQKMVGRIMDQPERDVERATFVRGRLEGTSGPRPA